VATASPAVADQVRQEEWWLSALHVTTAWESSKGSGVTVAVLDTGVDAEQPDLAGSVTTGPDFTSSGRNAGSPFWGVHGTAIASLIAGHGHGAQGGDGIMGVAPAAKILSLRVTLEGNDPKLNAGTAAALPAAIAKGIRYAASHGAQVIYLPMDPAPLAGISPGGSTAERAAVAYALSRNVVLVAPAGDGGAGTDPVNYPAAYPGVISVGAFNSSFTKASFTSRQPYVRLTAAGDGVVAATPSGYVTLHSTIAASAVVAGIAALIRAQFPTLSPAQVASALTQSTVFRPPGGLEDGSGYGTADAGAALLQAARINAAVPAHSGSGGAIKAPSSPPVHARGAGIWGTLRYAALGLAAVLLVTLAGFLLSGRARRRRARPARPAPSTRPARSTRSAPSARSARLGLRDAARAAAHAQPDFSAIPPVAGAQFASGQSGRVQFARPPFAGSQLSAGQLTDTQLSAGQLTDAQLTGSQLTDAHLSAGQLTGSQLAGPQNPDDDHADTALPADPAAEPPVPGDPFGAGSFPGDSFGEAPFPDPFGAAPLSGDPFGAAPLSGDPFGAAPLSGDPLPESAFPSSEVPGTGPFPAVSPGSGTASGPGRISRPHVTRPPRISGTPPWEPAEKPAGELPWSITAPAKSARRPTPARRVVPTGARPWGPATRDGSLPDGSSLGDTGPQRPASHRPGSHRPGSGRAAPDSSEAPDSTELGGSAPGSTPLPAPPLPDHGKHGGYGPAEEEGRLYVWNPAAVTESFSKMPPGESSRK
jgi:hypothetical protein